MSEIEKQSDSIKVISSLKDVFIQHPALLLSLLYFYLSVVGMSYTYKLLDSFHINIFDYFEFSDFLNLVLKTPEVFYYMLFNGGMILFLLFLLKSKPYEKLRIVFQKNKILNKLLKCILIFILSVIVLSPILTAQISARIQADFILHNKKPIHVSDNTFGFFLSKYVFAQNPIEIPTVKIILKHDKNIENIGWTDNKLKIIASTNKYIFVYDLDKEETHVIIVSNIIDISYLLS